MKRVLAAAALTLAAAASLALPGRPAAAITGGPVMGYNTWYDLGSNVTEASVLAQAQDLVNDGLAAAGYTTVTIDDGWQNGTRDSSGNITWSAARFPDGMPALAAQLHSMGLQFGIYTAIGTNTCTDGHSLPGSYGHYAADAGTFRSWGASFVKVDNCGGTPAGTTSAQLTTLFEQFGSSIRGDGMTYSQELPVLMTVGSADWNAAIKASPTFSNMWRIAPDEAYQASAATTIFGHLADDLHLHGFAGPYHWNDLDMLVPGQPATHPFDWSLASQQAQAGVWAIEASPLFISTDLATMTAAELGVVKNPDVIAIDQSGAQAPNSYLVGHVQAVVKHAEAGYAVLFADTGTGTASTKYTLAQLGISYASASFRNVWTGHVSTGASFVPSVPVGQSELVVITPA